MDSSSPYGTYVPIAPFHTENVISHVNDESFTSQFRLFAEEEVTDVDADQLAVGTHPSRLRQKRHIRLLPIHDI